MKKAYPAVDLWRFLMALVVILIHSYVFDLPMSRTAQGWCDLLRNTAVASFFCCNGFFCFYGLELKRDEDWKKFWKRWRKFLRLYLIWYLIYLPFGVYGEVAVYQAGAAKGILKILYRFLVTGWGYYSWQMWYLHAAIVGLAALAWLRRKGVGCRVLLLACALLYLAGEIMDSAYTNQFGSGFLALYYRLFYGTRNAVFYGGVFLSFGMFEEEKRRKTESGAAGTAGLLAAGLALYGVVMDMEAVSGCLSAVIACLVIRLLLSVPLPASPVWKRLRGMSGVMFYSHMLFVALFQLVVRKSGGEPDLAAAAGSLACSLLFSAFMEYLKEKKNPSACRIF